MQPTLPIAYDLKARVDDVIEFMIKKVDIEKHPPNEPTPWITFTVIVPKSDSSLWITRNACNLNKVLIFNNYPISRQELMTA